VREYLGWRLRKGSDSHGLMEWGGDRQGLNNGPGRGQGHVGALLVPVEERTAEGNSTRRGVPEGSDTANANG